MPPEASHFFHHPAAIYASQDTRQGGLRLPLSLKTEPSIDFNDSRRLPGPERASSSSAQEVRVYEHNNESFPAIALHLTSTAVRVPVHYF